MKAETKAKVREALVLASAALTSVLQGTGTRHEGLEARNEALAALALLDAQPVEPTPAEPRVWLLLEPGQPPQFSFDPPTAKAQAYWTRAGRSLVPLYDRPVEPTPEQVAEAVRGAYAKACSHNCSGYLEDGDLKRILAGLKGGKP